MGTFSLIISIISMVGFFVESGRLIYCMIHGDYEQALRAAAGIGLCLYGIVWFMDYRAAS